MMLVLAQASAEVSGTSATAESILFWVFATVAVGAGIGMVSLRNIVHAAMLLVVNLLSIAGLYLGLQSAFLSITQVIVYAGAIMVLFLFVIMLLGIDRDDLLTERDLLRTGGAVLGGLVLAAALLFAVGSDTLTTASACGTQATDGDATALPCVGLEGALAEQEQGSVGFLAESLFTDYVFPFEAAALLLVVATLGALVLGRRRDPAVRPDPTLVVPSQGELASMVALQGERAAGSAPRAAAPITDADVPDAADDAVPTHDGRPPTGTAVATDDPDPAAGTDARPAADEAADGDERGDG